MDKEMRAGVQLMVSLKLLYGDLKKHFMGRIFSTICPSHSCTRTCMQYQQAHMLMFVEISKYQRTVVCCKPLCINYLREAVHPMR